MSNENALSREAGRGHSRLTASIFAPILKFGLDLNGQVR